MKTSKTLTILMMVSLSTLIQTFFINIWVSFQLLDSNGNKRHQHRTIPFTDVLYNDIHKWTNHIAYLWFLISLLIASIIVSRIVYNNIFPKRRCWD